MKRCDLVRLVTEKAAPPVVRLRGKAQPMEVWFQEIRRGTNDHREARHSSGPIEHDGAMVFDHACRMGLEGIVSKRLDAPYRSGLSKVWLKSKNPLSEAVRREREEDWR